MKNIFLLLGIFSITFCACNKHHDDDATIATNSKERLKEVVDINTNTTAPYDTLGVENYTYDNSGRVTLMDSYGYDEAGIYYTRTSNYFYNGTDTLPARTVDTYNDINETSTETTWHTYVTGTRNLLIDSSISHEVSPGGTYNDTFALRYTYTVTSYQVTEDSYTSSGHQVYGPSTVDITKQNGNIIYQREDFGTTVETYNCTYDTHPNPYYNIAWFNNKRIPGIYKYYLDSYGLNNNVTEINNTSVTSPSPATISHYKYSYQYDSNGYPTQIIIQDQGSTDTGSLNKVIFTYFPTI